jgi:hypothetical protein
LNVGSLRQSVDGRGKSAEHRHFIGRQIAIHALLYFAQDTHGVSGRRAEPVVFGILITASDAAPEKFDGIIKLL